METWLRCCFGLLVAITFPSAGFAQAPPDWTAKIRLGKPLFITTPNGDRVEGVAGSVTADGIGVVTPDGIRMFPFAEIRRAERKDGVANGVLIGAGVGVALGLLALTDDACPDNSAGCRAEGSAIPIGGALYGALIGWGIDALVNRRTTLFESGSGPRVSLLTGRGAIGARISLAW